MRVKILEWGRAHIEYLLYILVYLSKNLGAITQRHYWNCLVNPTKNLNSFMSFYFTLEPDWTSITTPSWKLGEWWMEIFFFKSTSHPPHRPLRIMLPSRYSKAHLLCTYPPARRCCRMARDQGGTMHPWPAVSASLCSLSPGHCVVGSWLWRQTGCGGSGGQAPPRANTAGSSVELGFLSRAVHLG